MADLGFVNAVFSFELASVGTSGTASDWERRRILLNMLMHSLKLKNLRHDNVRTWRNSDW